MRTILLFACSFLTVTCLAAPTSAQTANPSGAATGQTAPQRVAPMSREDVDILLREARSAIAKGNYDEADQLISRAENARVRYSMLHMGATPASVRKELTRARNAAGNNPARGARLNPFASRDTAKQETVDPFLQAKRAGGQGSPATGNTTQANASDPANAAEGVIDNPITAAQLPQRLPTALPTPDRAVVPAGYDENEPTTKANGSAPKAGGFDLGEKLSTAAASLEAPESKTSAGGDQALPAPYDVVQANQNESTEMPTLEFPPQSPRYAQRTLPPQSSDQSSNFPAAEYPTTEQLPAPSFEPTGATPVDLNANAAAMQSAIKPSESLIDQADQATQAAARQLYSEIGKRQSEAIRLR
jgi:hypothetical protein